jgi:hypothetical protein
MVASVSVAQTADQQIPAVEVHPVGTTRDDPNGGQWFVTNVNPAETKQLQVRLYNSASVEQTVKLYLADIRFNRQGVPEVANVPTDVGTWGSFDDPSVTVAPLQNRIETFSITAPKNADPGDHIGAVVAEQAPAGSGLIRSIKRLAVRLYVTLPGDARKDFVIDRVNSQKDSAFFTRELTVTVRLRNTGRVRLEPTVHVDDAEAKGPQLLLSQSSERYVVTRPVKFWGGPMRLRVDAQSRSLGLAGPVRQLRVTVWVIPWHLLALLVLAIGLGFLVRIALRRRGGKYEAIQSDLRRIERLVMNQNGRHDPSEAGSERVGAEAAVRAAIKQARRAEDFDTAERLEDRLADVSNGDVPPPPAQPEPVPAPKPDSDSDEWAWPPPKRSDR